MAGAVRAHWPLTGRRGRGPGPGGLCELGVLVPSAMTRPLLTLGGRSISQ